MMQISGGRKLDGRDMDMPGHLILKAVYSRSGRVSRHVRLDDLVRVLHRLATLDLVDILHAGRDLAPDGVLVVEETGIVETDEELAVAGVRVGGARHRGGAAHMRLLVELGLQLLAGTAGAGALRAAGLGHEAIDHAMEHDAVVEALPHQFLDACHMVGRKVGTHLDGHGALGGLQNQSVLVVCHDLFSVDLVRRASNLNRTGRPATAFPSPSVNGIGVQRCNASASAVR